MNALSVSQQRKKHDHPLGAGWFDLRELLEEFRLQLSAADTFRGGGILEVTVSDATPNNFLGDPLLIHELLHNMASFACRHFDEGGIFINVHAELVRENKYCIGFTVTATGIGIPPRTIKAIFQPVSTSGRQADGSLYIAKTIAALLRGDLTVENTAGWGVRYHAQLIMESERSLDHFLSPQLDYSVHLQ